MEMSNLEAIYLDPESIDLQYKKQEQVSVKLKVLQQAVYKNYMVRKSKSTFHLNLHPIDRANSSKSHKIAVLPSPRKGQQKQISQQLFPQRKEMGCTMNKIEFSYRKSLGNTLFHARSTFSPRKSVGLMTGLRKRAEEQFQVKQKLEVQELIGQPQRSVFFKPEVTMTQRDSQTLLRKNSLFLINCLKTKHRNSLKNEPHIGDMPSAANHMKLGNFSDRVVSHNYINRFEYMEKAKQELMKEKVGNEYASKMVFLRGAPLFPEPW